MKYRTPLNDKESHLISDVSSQVYIMNSLGRKINLRVTISTGRLFVILANPVGRPPKT